MKHVVGEEHIVSEKEKEMFEQYLSKNQKELTEKDKELLENFDKNFYGNNAEESELKQVDLYEEARKAHKKLDSIVMEAMATCDYIAKGSNPLFAKVYKHDINDLMKDFYEGLEETRKKYKAAYAQKQSELIETEDKIKKLGILDALCYMDRYAENDLEKLEYRMSSVKSALKQGITIAELKVTGHAKSSSVDVEPRIKGTKVELVKADETEEY